MVFDLTLDASRIQIGIEYNQTAIFAATGYQSAILQRAQREYGSIVNFPVLRKRCISKWSAECSVDIVYFLLEKSGDCVGASSPNDDTAIRIARNDVTALREWQTCHVLRFFPSLEHTHALIQSAALVQCPKCNVTLASRDDLIAIQRMELHRNNGIDRTLKISQTILSKLIRLWHERNICAILTLVSVILWPFSPRCHSHTEIILSGESSMAANNAPLSARLKHKLFTEPVKSPFPIIATVANDTEFQTRMCGCENPCEWETTREYSLICIEYKLFSYQSIIAIVTGTLTRCD